MKKKQFTTTYSSKGELTPKDGNRLYELVTANLDGNYTINHITEIKGGSLDSSIITIIKNTKPNTTQEIEIKRDGPAYSITLNANSKTQFNNLQKKIDTYFKYLVDNYGATNR